MWNFTRSVEAMFSRWAVKRVFKFLLKKKLGHLILGDIDLEQLDVQLGTGTVQLSDLALNVDYINRKYGTAAGLIVKEGSIGALVLKMPWKGQGCQVEVDELEVVLCPCVGNSSPSGAESCSGRDTNSFNSGDLGKLERETVDDAGTSASMHVHEGVKTIAKMLKGLLTSFHVKVKRVLVAFDPCLERDERDTSCQMILVLRVTETECGTCLSEDFNSDNDEENFLGISGLTNFARFHGTAVELLQMDEVDKNKWPFSERFSGPRPSTAAIPILAGEHGGISGTVKLCIPWKNGSLDVHQVDSEVFLDPVELKLQPSVVKWLMLAWKSLQDIHHHATDSVYYNSASHLQSSDLSSFAIGTDKVFLDTGPCFADVSFPRAPETVTSSLLPGSNFISDWVPLSAEKYEDKTEEADFGTSLDHFFECFDEMRSSQSSLGGSGIWNWTNSVFSAITAASSLASGSFHIPSEQQHVQTNLKATISGISVVLCFDDENMKHLCVSSAGQRKFSSNAHFLGGKCLDVVFAMQVCPQKIRFESTIRHIEVADYFSDRMEFGSVDFNNVVNSKSLLIQHLQAEVLGAVTPFVSSTNDSDSPQSNGLGARDLSSIQSSLDLAIGGPDCESSEMEGLVKVMLLASSGASCSQCTVSSCYSDGNSIRSVSFSLELPQFVLWVDFDLVNMLFVLWRKVETSYEVKNSRDGSMSEATGMMHGSPFLETMKRATCPCAASSSPKESLQGNIVVPNARVILCFPFEDNNHVRRHLAWDQFIALNISSPLALGKKKVPGVNNLSHANVQKQYSLRASHSVNLNAGNFDLYLVLSSEKGNLGDCCGLERKRFSARHVLCVTSESGSGSLINMIWQDASVTGPWLVKRVKDLAASGNLGSRSKVIGKGNEFASVTTKQDVEDSKFRLHREMISSSSFFLHADLPPVRVTLDSLLYKHLLCLIGQAIDGLSCVSRDPLTAPEDCSNSQTSLLLECNSVEILLSPGTETFLKGSIHDELLGSWQHLKLKIQKFELLSVSNIGGVRGASLLWGGHGEGQLGGVVSGSQNQELLLISCSNSSMRRGDGGGSNAMSYGLAGSDIIHLWDPQSFARSTSISVRCGTIVAIRGRLDWLECISCLFRVASPENDCAVDEHLPNRDSKDSAPWETSFVLNLVDVGLSYEPFSKIPSASDEVSDINSRSGVLNDGFSHIACLLAAASFSISNAVVASSMGDDYRITVRDLGLLLSIATRSENIVGLYSVENLHKNGYVRVAREAFTEATLRTNCTNGLQWELECSEFHTPVVFDTCHDTTSGLIRLVAELQQLFSPNIEESAVHLQARWNNVQQATEKNSLNDEARICNSGSASSASSDRGTEPNASGLMDEICDDAFNIDGNQLHALDSCESRYYILPDGTGLGDACSTRAPEGSSMSGQTSSLTNGCIPDIIECFYRPEMTPSELPLVNQPLKEYGCRPKRVDNGGMEKENVGWYKDASIRIVEDHISQTSLDDCPKQFRDSNLSCSNCLKIADPTDIQMPRGQIRLKNIGVRWMMHAGSDWVDLGKLESTNVRGRDRSVCLELALLGIDFQYSIFAEGQICASKISLAVKDLYLYDNSKDAPWKLVLGYYGSKERPRDSSANAFKLDLEAVRPNPSIPLDEYRLRMGFLPLLLHLHQVHLDFLVDFFGEKSLQVEQSPVPALHLDCQQTITEEALLPYFQKFDIWPLLVRVDYTPCRVDLTALRGGKYVELINLVPWKGVELQLKHVHAVGVYGWSTVCETIIGDWLEDISQNQIHKLLHGLPTIRSLVAVGSGAAKLVSLPVKSYKKDHKLLKGMQRGTVAFLKSISLEAVGLGLHLAAGAHDILLQAEYILTSIPPVSSPVASRTKTNTRGNQPKDAQQGFQQACESLSNGLGRSASALVQAPIKSYQRGAGAGSALASAVRAAPAAALAPASAAAGAVRFALLGVRNSLDPEHKRESMDKYRGPTQPRERS